MDAVEFLKKARDYCKKRKCVECELSNTACYGGVCAVLEEQYCDDDEIEMLVNSIEEVEV